MPRAKWYPPQLRRDLVTRLYFRASDQTLNLEHSAHTHEAQTSSYAVLYRDSTSKRETGIEVHTLMKTKTPKLCVTATPPMSNQQQTRLFKLIEAYGHGLDVRFCAFTGHSMSREFFNECCSWH